MLVSPSSHTLGATRRQVEPLVTRPRKARKSPVQSKEYTGANGSRKALRAPAAGAIIPPMRRGVARVGSVAALLVGTAVGPGAQSREGAVDLGTILQRAGEKVAEYFVRAQSLVCLETVRLQPLGMGLTAEGFARGRPVGVAPVVGPVPGHGPPARGQDAAPGAEGERPHAPQGRSGQLHVARAAVQRDPAAVDAPARAAARLRVLAGQAREGSTAASSWW